MYEDPFPSWYIVIAIFVIKFFSAFIFVGNSKKYYQNSNFFWDFVLVTEKNVVVIAVNIFTYLIKATSRDTYLNEDLWSVKKNVCKMHKFNQWLLQDYLCYLLITVKVMDLLFLLSHWFVIFTHITFLPKIDWKILWWFTGKLISS